VVPKRKALVHVNHIQTVFFVLTFEKLKYLDFFLSLPLEALLIPHDLECDVLIRFVVDGFYHLAEGSLAYLLHDFVSVGDMVVGDVKIKVFFVVVSVVVAFVHSRRQLLRVAPEIIDLLVFAYLGLFEEGEFVAVFSQNFRRRHRGTGSRRAGRPRRRRKRRSGRRRHGAGTAAGARVVAGRSTQRVGPMTLRVGNG